MEMAGFSKFLPKDRNTIIKDNISWHFPYLSANMTPWRLEDVKQALQKHGYKDACKILYYNYIYFDTMLV